MENAIINKEQEIFSGSLTSKLFIDLIDKKGYVNYQNTNEKFNCKIELAKGGSQIFLNEDFDLLIPDEVSKYDLENTKIIYNALSGISPTQATDRRLWSYLTHVTFWDYMKKRWPMDIAEPNKKIRYIKERYFLENLNLRSLTHNGISRLWWFGYLTYDSNRDNPWELTETLLKVQDLPTSLMERALGANKNIRVGVLEFFQENPEYLTSKNIQEMMKRLNLAGGVSNLPYFTIDEIKVLMMKLKFKIE